MDVLRWHVETQIPAHIKAASDLLFPSDMGGFRAGPVLDMPFEQVSVAIKLVKHVTPLGMRRTYQDLARMREGIVKIISLAGVREVMAREAGTGGIEVVSIGDESKNGQLGTKVRWRLWRGRQLLEKHLIVFVESGLVQTRPSRQSRAALILRWP